MRKMSNKEFKEILTASGDDFEVYGYEGIINLLVLYHRWESDRMKDISPILSDYDNQIANKLHETLEERGYYN